MGRELLEKVVNQGVGGNLNSFFCDVSNNYVELKDDLAAYSDDQFTDFRAIGEIVFNPNEKLVVVTARVLGELTERSGKKAQYEKAKKILKDYMKYDAGIFVFSDAAGSFRFSLVYGQAQGTKRVFSSFRRFTYFVSRDQTNKTFYDRIGQCDFASLDIIKDAFSVEKVNKEFYQQIAKFYYRLTGKNGYKKELVLPSVGEGDEKKYEEFAVRLIGRIIFCWFLRHKKSSTNIPLIPREVLSLAAAESQPNYYHVILEPMFFEVMNHPMKERKPVTIPRSELIPFLNGGLFEPHDNDFYKPSLINALKIQDKWFADLFSVLEQYNFTIDENSTVDADVSVDPEMLGRIFENLLAEVVPETGETARKATGSYYTPRAIVDYMVEQSLKQYLLTKTSLAEDKLDSLLSYEDSEVPLSDSERLDIVKALKEIKVSDPACGSGAFPMGILHRMLLVLEKVDPRLEIWRRQYLDALDPIVRQVVMKNIRRENWAYIRKLMIIRDCIYGVDIQPIAVEIAKLRCFLSLVVDEIIVDSEENRGIEPLPNLEFKFVAANTLIGLPKTASQSAFGVTETINKLKELRESYLRSFGAEKAQIEKEFRATQQKLFKENVQWAVADTLVKQLTDWDPFSYESCGWFDPGWMFDIGDGFDVAIANPPYIFARNSQMKGLTDTDKKYFYKHYQLAEYQVNLYPLFVEKATSLLKPNGCLCFITPNNWLTINTNRKMRKFVLSQSDIKIVNFYSHVFESSQVDSSIIIYRKASDSKRLALCEYTDTVRPIKEAECDFFLSQRDYIINIEAFKDTVIAGIINRIDSNSMPLEQVADVKAGLVAYEEGKGNPPQTRAMKEKRVYHSTRKLDNTYIKYSDGKDVCRYRLGWSGEYLKYGDNLAAPRKDFRLYSTKRILVRQIPSNPPYCINACLVEETILNDRNSMNIINFKESPECILGILNSRLVSFWFFHKFGKMQRNIFPQFKVNELAAFPLPKNRANKQVEIAELVKKILAAKKRDPDADTTALEDKIARMVYELYGLTEEEIKVVEGTFKK